MKRILINATQKEELRVAIVIDKNLIDLDIEVTSLYQKKGNIYKGTVVRIEPSLEAAFIDYGGNRHGFLPFKEISKSYYKDTTESVANPTIKSSIREGQQVLVQIEREERNNKGSALTTFISLAGRYLVMMPNNPYGGGISRRVEGKERSELRELLSQLKIKDEESIIVRTAGIGHSIKELQWDLDNLKKQWETIIVAAKSKPAPFLVYQENNILIRALRDHFDESFDEIIIDDKNIYQNAKDFLNKIMPQYVGKLKLYEETTPLFTTYQVERQIETAYEREVRLPSGGMVAFDQTEALLSIDINSSKATKGRNIEVTAFSTNLEACKEIARQLRIRDAGGLIVIDFIDMQLYNNQKAVENELITALKPDRARIQTGNISRFGLLEMSRQHLRPSLGDTSHISCPRCKGSGTIRTVESCALAALRTIEDEAVQQGITRVIAYLPITVTSFLLNEKRTNISEIESHCQVNLKIIPDINLETPHFRVTHHKADDKKDLHKLSHNLIQPHDSLDISLTDESKAPGKYQKPMLDFILPKKAVPNTQRGKKLLNSLCNLFKSKRTAEAQEQQTSTVLDREHNKQSRSDQNRSRPYRNRRRPDQQRRQTKQPGRSPRSTQRGNRGNQSSQTSGNSRGNRSSRDAPQRQQQPQQRQARSSQQNEQASQPFYSPDTQIKSDTASDTHKDYQPPVDTISPIPDYSEVNKPSHQSASIPDTEKNLYVPDKPATDTVALTDTAETPLTQQIEQPKAPPPPLREIGKPTGMTQIETDNNNK